MRLRRLECGRTSLYIFRQLSIATFASIRFLNHCIPRHSSRNFPLKLSFDPFCQGLPGSMGAVSIPAWSNHCSTTLETNSGPLSDRRYFGAPKCRNGRSSTHLDSSTVHAIYSPDSI